ncbi:hypothetical protein NDU88_004782 [Pleurodeles waltl]|uniref:Uncharacterized protein n=1 Tax=Pleurodeles waltl TaxID=8319 RepID=A0AAV7W5Y6_PLEWA|nr:hypothetical protein NDU88_004782 [Pleurodeles waltl]
MSPCSSPPPSVPTSGAVGNKVVWIGSGGAPGQRQSYGPQGAQEKRAPYQSSPGRLLSPCLLTVRAPAAGKHQAPSPGWEANFTPSGVPTRHSDLPLTPRDGPAHSLRARRGTPHVPGPRPQPASRPPGTIPAGPHESAGGHPRGNGPSPVAPPAIAAHLLLRSEPAAPQFSAGRPRPSARPQPLRSPDRPREPRRSPRGPSRAATVSPRLQQSFRSTLSATLPAPARLGIRLKSAPPEPSG